MSGVSAAFSGKSDGRINAVADRVAVRRISTGASCLRLCATLTSIDSREADGRGGWVHSTTSVSRRSSRFVRTLHRSVTAA